jgi:putative ABC transport system substrate-binding protein
MRRRNFIALLGGAAAAWPLAAWAQQQTATPVIGFLNTRSPEEAAHLVAAFHRGLSETGYVEGQNVTIQYRWAHGQYGQLPAFAADLVRQSVNVIATTGGEPTALAAKNATSTIPIVFSVGGDPVKAGLVTSLNRPGGNLTGVNQFADALQGKRLGLLHELVPRAIVIGVLMNPNFPPAEHQLRDVQDAARAMGLQIYVMRASTDAEIDAAFEAIAQQHISALALTGDPFFDTRREKLVALAARYAVPAMYHFRDYAVAGGLMSYGTMLSDAYRNVGAYTGKILNGANPADLPVMQLSKFELVLNLKAARTLGLAFPPGLLAIADEVIE